MTNKLQNEFDLDALFATEKSDAITPSDTFMARVLADADEIHAARQKLAPVVSPTPWWQGFVQHLGDWQAVSAFATCACFGLYLGYASTFDQVLGLVQSQETADLLDVRDSFSVASEFEISFLEG